MKKILFSLLVIFLLTACQGPAETQNVQIDATDIPPQEVFGLPDVPDIPGLETAELSLVARELVLELDGISIGDFFELSFKALSARSQEGIVSAGVEEYYEFEEAALDDISEEYMRETYELFRVVLAMLRTYDRDSLTTEEQVSYDVYEWYLDDQVMAEEFLLFGFPVSFMVTTSIPVQTLRFFTVYHPLENAADVENYITRLSFVDVKFGQMIDLLEKSEEAGLVHPRFALEWSYGDIRNIANGIATTTPFYTNLRDKLYEVPGLDDEDIKDYLESAEEVIEDSVIPAYQDLLEQIEHMLTVATEDDGLWQFEGGDEYYNYLLHHYTTTDMTVDEIHNLGLQELERIQAEMRGVFNGLGYPEDESLPELYERVAEDGGFVPADEMVETFEAIITEAEENLSVAFDIFPKTEVIVVGGPIGGFYSRGSYDGSRPGMFFAQVSGRGAPLFDMYSLAYHEAIPGHHFQISLAQEMDLPVFRNEVTLTGYAEGWALYAERLAWELGWYEDNPYGNLGRLQYEAWRAARLVVDTGLHAKGWTYDEAFEFLVENSGLDSDTAYFEIGRYIVYPGQATAYMVGMLKMLEIRQMAMDQLGEDFDLIEFHGVVLSSGSLPLSVLEEVVEDYVESKLE
jgi:uncharacterized protein (DUF885 family)